MRIANVQYGGLELRVKAKGVPAHGATPEMGSNAVEKCIIAAYNLLTSIKDAVVSVQYFKGGDPEDYVIPDECEMRFELFFKPEVKAESMLTRVKGLLPQNGFEIIVKEAYDGFISRRTSALLEKAMKKVGCQIEFSDMPSWTDAVNLCSLCLLKLPTLSSFDKPALIGWLHLRLHLSRQDLLCV
jgi:acetylornithine deacetylase/succinyl-diaminopimelate desuccinylase-like protein